MAATVYARLKRLMIEQLAVDDEEIVPSASFVDDLNADSLELVDFTCAVEEEFDIKIPDDDARRLLTVQDAVDYIEEHMA